MVHIGLDVHQAKTMIYWIDTQTGETCGGAFEVPTPEIVTHLPRLPGDKRCVLEAGSYSLFVTRALESYDAEVQVVDAFRARRLIEGMFGLKKTDKIDAKGLALASAANGLDRARVWIPDRSTQLLRELTRNRTRLVNQSVRAQNHVRKFLGRFGHRCASKSLLGKRAGVWLDQLERTLDPELKIVLQSLRRAMVSAQSEVDFLSRAIVEQTKHHPDCQLLQTIPGIGPQIAASLLAEIGDIARFATAKELRGYSGLVPRVSQSGQQSHTGPLTKAGNVYLRRAMVLAAQLFSRNGATRDLRLRRWYMKLVFRHGPNPAKVALARRMLDLIHAMLRDRAPFDADRHRVAQ